MHVVCDGSDLGRVGVRRDDIAVDHDVVRLVEGSLDRGPSLTLSLGLEIC